MMRMQKAGELPLRVTHNDTKSNNALIDNMTDRALAVIDLDTIMPGLAGFDFGDMIRYGANNAEEDEKDLSKVFIRLDFFEQYARGFIKATKKSLTKKEIETLPLGAFTMTVECGTRFLADYLQGDLYFKTDYPEHNLDRAKNQLALDISLMHNEETLHQIIREAYSHY